MTSTNSVYQNVNTDIKTDSFEQGAQKEFLGDQVKKQVWNEDQATSGFTPFVCGKSYFKILK